MKRVLLTGASGFVGQHAIAPLRIRGFEVHAVRFRGATTVDDGAFWHQVDLHDFAETRSIVKAVQPTHLLHFAWYAKPGEFWHSIENLRWVQTSLNLLEVFASEDGRRVVTAGTCAEYDWRFGCCREGLTPCEPQQLYGSSKNSLHIQSEALAGASGLSSAWGRIFFLYGPHEPETRLVSSTIRSLLKGERAHCANPGLVRDFLHVEDAGTAFAALLDSSVSGPVNVASGRPLPLRELVRKIADELARPDLLELGASTVRADEPPFLVADVTRLRTEVGWQPRYSLASGLRQTIEWWRHDLGSHAGKRRMSEPR